MKRQFGFHWLAELGALNAGDGGPLEAAVKIAKAAGCNLFELACAPINGLTAIETAQAVKAGGMDTVAFCRFFPDNGSFGDPLGDDGASKLALETFQGDVAFIQELRSNGLTVECITGPSCLMLAQQYTDAPTTFRRLVEFVGKQGEIINGTDLILALEYLRIQEDQAIGGIKTLVKLLGEVKHPQIGWHGDVFHMIERGEDPVASIRYAGSHLKCLHAHSQKRVAPGAFYLDGIREATDTVNWWLIGQMLDRRGYKGPVTPEPFGEAIRKLVPALGEGLPPAIASDRYYKLAHDHLTLCGLI